MERKGFIGGSDMNRIMSGDWLDLWLIKTGRKESDDLSDNLAVQLGSYTEQFNIDWFSKSLINNRSVSDTQKVFKITWEGIPLKGAVDGMITQDNAVLECKHTYEYNTIQNCLERYMPQIQFYMWLSSSDSCYLSVIFGNRRWESVNVSYDKDYVEKMKVHLVEFWRCVSSDIEPFQGTSVEVPYELGISPISIDNILVDKMIRRDANTDNEFISRCHDYIEQEANAKIFDNAKADLKAMVGDDEREVYCDLLTIKRDKRGSLRITKKEN